MLLHHSQDLIVPILSNAVFYFMLTVFGIFAAVLVKSLYNIFFHPLRSYPGPFFGRASRLYQTYWDLVGMNHIKIKEWHDKYGEVVRIAPNELSYISVQAWKDIHGHRSKDRPGSFEKDPSFFNRQVNGARTIQTATDDDHRRMRRLQAHAFSEKALKGQEDLLQKYVDLFIQQLRRNTSTQKEHYVDIMQWFNFLTFDIIGDLAFGAPFHCLDQGVWHKWISGVFTFVKSGNWIRAGRRLPSPLKEIAMFFIPRSLIDGRVYQYEFSRDQLDKRLEMDTDRTDFMSYILRQTGNEKGMTIPELHVGASFLIIAGSETTATLLSGAVYYLLTNPVCLENLTLKIRTRYPKEADIRMATIAQDQYLNAVLEECLRMYPPVPNAFPRVTPENGEVICGQFVPGGTVVGIPHYSMYHSATNFLEPDKFYPERWLDDSRFCDDNKNAFQPFSHGPRNCLGKNLAYAEMRITLARLLWNFDLEMDPKCEGWAEKQLTYTLWVKDKLNVKLIPVSR